MLAELARSRAQLQAVASVLEEPEPTGTFETVVTAAEQPKAAERAAESTVEVLDEGWSEHAVGPAETPWNGDDDERQQEYADAAGESLQEHLLWQLELASLAPRELAIARAIVDAISDDGYLTESLEEIAQTLRPELECSTGEIAAVLAGVQALDPPGVGARSVGECIELQLRQLDPATPGFDTALQIARHHLGLVAERELSLLRRELRATEEEIAAALALVRACHPRPGATVILEHRPDARFLQGVDAGVAVLGRVRNLRNVDDGRGPHVDQAERVHQFARIGVVRLVGRGEQALHIADAPAGQAIQELPHAHAESRLVAQPQELQAGRAC